MRRGRGYDINPISRELTWLKALGPDDAWLEALRAKAARVAAHADKQRTRKAEATQRYSDVDRKQFAPHVHDTWAVGVLEGFATYVPGAAVG